VNVAINDTPPAKGRISSLRAMMHYLRPYRLLVAGATLALVVTSSGVLGMGAALRYLVDEGIAKGDPVLLGNAYVVLLGVVLLLSVATYARYLLVSWVGEKVVADIRRDVFSHVISLDATFFETTRTGDILARITTDTTLLQTVVGSSVSIFLRNTLLFFGGVTMLVITSPRLTQYVLLMLPLVLIPILTLGKRVRVLSRETQNRVADISSHAEETLSAMRTVQALALENQQNRRFGERVGESLATSLKRIRMRAALTAIVIALVFGAIITVLYIGGQDVMAGRISAGDLSAFIFYAVVVAGALGAVSEVIGELQRAGGATERLIELRAVEAVIRAPADPEPLPRVPTGAVAFEKVVFHYPSRPDTRALDSVSFTVAPGETLALVGPSGAGKSTVFQLLLRFYDPAEGMITFDGVDIRRFDPRDLRSLIGVVPQDPVIFSTNVWDNIRAGKETATDEEVHIAAEIANARGFIEALPLGFDTYLGEKGVRLSGGQKQRIAIARAIVRDPKLLLLDEATSALDSESESAVQQALTRAMRGRTTLVIAHRLSTIRGANRIAVVDQGRIEAIGTHDALMRESPLYQRLAALQFKG
jgi:ATP-binding cassette subfamily B protein